MNNYPAIIAVIAKIEDWISVLSLDTRAMFMVIFIRDFKRGVTSFNYDLSRKRENEQKAQVFIVGVKANLECHDLSIECTHAFLCIQAQQRRFILYFKGFDEDANLFF